VCFLLLSVAVTPSLGGSDLKLADSLFAGGQYYDAATEYERYLFMHPDSSLNPVVRGRLVEAYASSGEEDRGAAILPLVTAGQESLGWEAEYALATAYAKDGRTYQARAELLDLLNMPCDSSHRDAVDLSLGWLEVDDGEFAGAAQHFRQAHDARLARSCDSIGNLRHLNPDVAVMLSTFIPGSGEIYAGSVKQGLASFAVNAVILVGAGYSLATLHFLDAAILLSVFGGRFYTGTRSNARDLVLEHNLAVVKKAADDLRRRYLPR
jgi:tetratricopeptide (TPR) repeat protein